MRIFLPSSDLLLSAQILSDKDRKTSLDSAVKLLNTLTRNANHYRDHPLYFAFLGFEPVLKLLINYFTLIESSNQKKITNTYEIITETIRFPEWFNNPFRVANHQGYLLNHDYKYYESFDWDVILNDDIIYGAN